MTAAKQTPEEFFYEWAGCAYDPAKETPEEGKRRGAKALAEAERRASDEGMSFEWQVDPTCDSSEHSDEEPPWSLWACCCRSQDGEILSSLTAIDFGRDVEPWGQPYRRVVEAELASEALGD